MANIYDQAKQMYSTIKKYRGSGLPLLNKAVETGKNFISSFNPNAPIQGKAWNYQDPGVLGKSNNAPMSSPSPKPVQPVVAPVQAQVPPAVVNPPVQQNYESSALARNPSFSNYNLTPDVKNAVMSASQKFDVPHQFLFDLFAQESSLQPDKVNTTPEGIAAGNPTGLGQFTDETWRQVMGYQRDPGSSLYNVLPNSNRQDPYTNALATAYLIKMGQLGKWDASEDVWGEFWTPQELEQLGFYDQSLYHVKGVRPSVRLSKGKKKQ